MVEFKAIGILTILMSILNYMKCTNVAPPPSLYCTDLNPQNNVDIEQVKYIAFTFELNLSTIEFKINSFYCLLN